MALCKFIAFVYFFVEYNSFEFENITKKIPLNQISAWMKQSTICSALFLLTELHQWVQ